MAARALALLLLCAAPAAALKIDQSYSCPYPAQTGLQTIHPDGRVTWIVFEGYEPPPKSRSVRHKKRLSPSDVKELSAVVAKSGYRKMPERAESFPPRHDQTDACSRSLEITRGGKIKRISYSDGDVPEDLRRLVAAIAAIVERHAWERDLYPGETP